MPVKELSRADLIALAHKADAAFQAIDEIKDELRLATSAAPEEGNIVSAPTWLVFATGYAAAAADMCAGLEDVINRHTPNPEDDETDPANLS